MLETFVSFVFLPFYRKKSNKSDSLFKIVLIFAPLKLKITKNYQNDNVLSTYDHYYANVGDGHYHNDDPSGLG